MHWLATTSPVAISTTAMTSSPLPSATLPAALAFQAPAKPFTGNVIAPTTLQGTRCLCHCYPWSWPHCSSRCCHPPRYLHSIGTKVCHSVWCRQEQVHHFCTLDYAWPPVLRLCYQALWLSAFTSHGVNQVTGRCCCQCWACEVQQPPLQFVQVGQWAPPTCSFPLQRSTRHVVHCLTLL
jgi:hypothetical protein